MVACPLIALLFSVGPTDPVVPEAEVLSGSAVAALAFEPWAHLAVENCPALLAAARVQYTPIDGGYTERVASPKGTRVCHVPQALQYLSGPGGVRYTTYMLVNCRMALALSRFEVVANRVVKAEFGPRARLRTVVSLGAFACRPLRHNREVQSQHSFGNALDVRRLVVDGFGKADIEADWDGGPDRRSARASRFLHALVETLRAERVFFNVLTPDEDAGHQNHLHFDLDEARSGLSEALALEEPDWGTTDASAPERIAEPAGPKVPSRDRAALRTLSLDLEGTATGEP